MSGNLQSNPTAFIPVRLSNGTGFYVAGSGGGGSPPYAGTPLGYQQIATTASLVSLTVPPGATFALVITVGATARWRDDGTAPTTTVGMPLYAGNAFEISGDLSQIQFIAEAGTVEYNISYYM